MRNQPGTHNLLDRAQWRNKEPLKFLDAAREIWCDDGRLGNRIRPKVRTKLKDVSLATPQQAAEQRETWRETGVEACQGRIDARGAG